MSCENCGDMIVVRTSNDDELCLECIFSNSDYGLRVSN